MATTNPDGTITVQQGDTLSGLYGSNYQAASGYTGDPTKLAIGTVLPAPKAASSSPASGVPTTLTSDHLKPGGTPTVPTGGSSSPTGGTTPPNAAAVPLQNLTDAETAAKTSAETISSNIVGLTKGLSGEAADTAGIQTTGKVATLKTQLQDYNSQVLTKTAALKEFDTQQEQIQQNISQQPVAMSIITGQQAEQSRQSAITRASMVSEIGMLNAQVQATQGNITLATETAKAAIDAKYAPIKEQIDIQQKQLAAIEPLLTSAEKKDAANQSLKITQYQSQIDKEKQNAQNVSAVALEAAKNGAPASVISAIGKSTDQNGAIVAAKGFLSDTLANQIKQATLTKLNLENKKARDEAAGGGNVVLQNPATGAGVNISADIAPYVDFSNNGVSYMDASSLQGTASEKTALINKATQAGLKVITNKNTAADISNIKDANNKLDSISTIMSGLTQPSALARTLGGMGLTKLATLTESDPQKSAAGALSSVGLDMLKALSGVQGFRGNSTVVAQINDHMPTIYDTTDTANQKIAYIRTLISDREDGLVGTPPPSTGPQMYAGITLPASPTSTGSTYGGVVLPH